MHGGVNRKAAGFKRELRMVKWKLDRARKKKEVLNRCINRCQASHDRVYVRKPRVKRMKGPAPATHGHGMDF